MLPSPVESIVIILYIFRADSFRKQSFNSLEKMNFEVTIGDNSDNFTVKTYPAD